MISLARLLIDYDPDLLQVIAAQWDVDLDVRDRNLAAETLSAAILRPEGIGSTWERLSEEEQKALGDLLNRDGRLSYAHFTRIYGEIRPMGPARREREKPWLTPENVTESLYYRGLIARSFFQERGGAQEFIFIPPDLADRLPRPSSGVGKVSPGYPVAPPRRLSDGYSTAADDIATLLAYLMVREAHALEWLTPHPMPQIDRHLRRPHNPTYRSWLVQMAYDLGMVRDETWMTQTLTHVDREMTRPWLEAPVDHQLRSLTDAWFRSITWNDLTHTPGLEAEVWSNDPLKARLLIRELLAAIPLEIWWSTESVLDYARQTQPDFQRPGGDYGSWYIRDSYTGTILHGFEYWDFIEGALLRFLIEGPMHWLGLVKAGQGTLLKTALGEGFCTGDWPSRADPEVSISVDQQGVITVPLRLARYDRLQIARFTSWIGSPGPSQFVPTGRNRESGDYLYRLTAQSLNRAKEQGIEIATHVIPFLGRLSAGSVPRNVSEMLEGWYNRTDEVIVHDVVIVAAKDLGIDERVRNNKRAGKWLGQQVGPHAYTVQREDLPPLLNALREMGLLPHFKGHEKDDWP